MAPQKRTHVLQKNLKEKKKNVTKSSTLVHKTINSLRYPHNSFWRTSVLFLRSLIHLFWNSGDVCLGFKARGGSPYLCASLPVMESSDSPLVQYLLTYWCQTILIHVLVNKHWSGSRPRSIMLLPRSVRQDRCSTD